MNSTKSTTFTRRSFLASTLAACSAPALLHGQQPGRGQSDADDVPWLAEVQRVPKQLPDDAPQLNPLLVDAAGRPVTTVAGWHARRAEIRRRWLDFLRPLDIDRQSPPKWNVVEEDRDAGVVRQLIRYNVEPDLPVDAYLLKPMTASDGRLPGVVVLHSTVNHSIRQPAGVEGRPEKAFGLKLAQKGCVAICPRNFLWPTNHKISAHPETERFQQRHPKSTGMAKMLFDAQVALDILASLPEVDVERLGTVGHSLGAKEVVYLAAFDPRIKVAVSSEGGIGKGFSNWDAPWYLGAAIKQPEFTLEHHELLGLIAPRPFLLLGGDSADGVRSWPFIEAALPVYKLHGGPARVGLFNHRQGHSVPPEAERRIYEWFDAYL